MVVAQIFAIFMIITNPALFGLFGAVLIGCGFGDDINVCNSISQMPGNAETDRNGFHSYWQCSMNSRCNGWPETDH